MKKILGALFCLFMASCATAQTPTTPPASTPIGIIGVLINDFNTAQANYSAAAAAQPAGSSLQAKFTAAAQCMSDSASRLQGLQGVGGGSVKGLISLGSVVYINTLELQAQIAAGSQGSAACDQLVGQMVRGLNNQILQALPGVIIPKL